MARIKWIGEQMEAPPGAFFWRPGEERDIDDDAEVERLLQHPNFQRVKQTKAPPEPGEAPPVPDEQPAPQAAAAEGS